MILSRAPRRGLSLLEVIVAMAIFLMSLIGLNQLLTLGGQNAVEASQRNEAARLCQSKLNEVLSGSVPLNNSGDTPFDEDPDYSWSVTADQGQANGLWYVTVKVTRQRSNGTTFDCSISQMVLDPSVVGSTQDSLAINVGTAPATTGATTPTTPMTGKATTPTTKKGP